MSLPLRINTFYNSSQSLNIKLYVSSDDSTLKQKYIDAAIKHNDQMQHNPFPDAGFDIFTPTTTMCSNTSVNKINFQVKIQASIDYANNDSHPCGFILCPRSSLSKTPLRLANSIGIIDSGYRGDLIGKFDCLYQENYSIEQYEKLLQIISPTMCPIYIEIVENESDLGASTERGSGGFGSTSNN